METTMIISMDDYRRLDHEYDSGDDADKRRAYGGCDRRGSAMVQPRLATVQEESLDSPELPADFDDFDAKEFIERAYSLATQI